MDTYRIRLILIFLLGAVMASAQYTTDTKDEQVARKKLRIGLDTSKYYTSQVTVIDGTSTHRQAVTSKSVWDLFSTLSATVTTDATLSGAGTVGSPLKIAAQSAGTGQVLKWNGSTWLPAADDNSGMTYTAGTGIGIVSGVISNTGDLSNTNEIELPTQIGNTGKVLSTNGTAPSWITANAGTVTSVGLSLPSSIFTPSGSPVTTSGTLTGTLATQTANTVFAGPTTGAAAAPTFRSLVAEDVTAAGGVTGTGITNYLTKFTGASVIAGSQVFDNGTNVGIGTATPGQKLDINGTANASEYWLSGFSYTRMALTASGGGFMGGYNLKASAGEPVHDSNGSLSGYRYTVGGVLLFASTSQVAGTAATPKAHLSSIGLGIGLQNPAASLHVQGNGTGTGTFTARFHNSTGTNNALMIRDDGNVGIGTGSPGQKLDINGITNSGEYWVNSTSYSRVAIPESSGGFMGGYNLKAAIGLPVHDSNGSLSGYRYTPTGVLLFASTSQVAGTAATPKAHLSSIGLGIGLQNPSASLSVQGNGSTSSTFNSRFANSSGLFALSIRDDRAVIFDNLTGTGNRLLQLDATGIATRSSLDPATLVTGNIYTADGTTSAARTVTIGANRLTFLTSNTSGTYPGLVSQTYNDGVTNNNYFTGRDHTTTDRFYISAEYPDVVARCINGDMVVRGGTGVRLTAGSPSAKTVKWTADGTFQLPASAAPTSPVSGEMWYSSATNKLTYRESGSTRSVASIEGDITGNALQVITGANTPGGNDLTYRFDALAGAFTVTLGASLQEGRTYIMRCVRNGTNAVTFTAAASHTLAIDTDSTLTPSTLVAGASGTGIAAPYKIYHVRRMDTIIYIN